MNEIWKPAVGFDGYEVSNLGNVRSFKRKTPRILKPSLGCAGYLRVGLMLGDKQKTLLVHRLVAIAFIPNPDNKREVNHVDGNKFNNCVDNLTWTTPSENTKHAFDTGLAKVLRGVDNGRTNLTAEQVAEIRRLYVKGSSELGCNALAKKFGIGRTTVLRIVRGETFKTI